MVDTRSEPRLYAAQIGTTILSDLTTAGGMQPRISPGNDALLFCGLNDKTGKREIFRLSLTDKSAVPENLTNTPEDDQYDAAWSKDGSKIAFVVEKASADDKASVTTGNPSIWILDMKNPGKPIQLTANGSVDDQPVWDPSGEFISWRFNPDISPRSTRRSRRKKVGALTFTLRNSVKFAVRPRRSFLCVLCALRGASPRCISVRLQPRRPVGPSRSADYARSVDSDCPFPVNSDS
jgi:dipeptidyl aminopeptidase/acylaminoacyl peptidase